MPEAQPGQEQRMEGWTKNAFGVKDGGECYRTIAGRRWRWDARDVEQVRALGGRCRKGPDDQGCFVHPDDEERVAE